MAKFKCNQTNNIFEFVVEHDIKTMRTHPEYTEIIAEVVPQVEEPQVKKVSVGRPKKTVEEVL